MPKGEQRHMSLVAAVIKHHAPFSHTTQLVCNDFPFFSFVHLSSSATIKFKVSSIPLRLLESTSLM